MKTKIFENFDLQIPEKDSEMNTNTNPGSTKMKTKNMTTPLVRNSINLPSFPLIPMKLSLKLLVTLVSASFCLQASAATITVTNTTDNDPGSLRQAIAAAASGDTINFDAALNGQTITLTSGELLINKNLTITGPGANLLAINGNATSRVFYISSGDVTISGLTITNGTAAGGGGILNDHATLTISNCTLSGNSATGNFGGGIYNNGGTLTISASTLSGNSAAIGGGIDNFNATLTITNSTLSGNSASGPAGFFLGGGIANVDNTGSATLTITNSTLSGNSATNGGGIGNENNNGSATVEIGNTILNNAGTSGANIANDSGTVSSDGYNLSSDGGVVNLGTGTGDLNATGDQISTDPMLGPLQNNGGPTFTHALLVGSPAIDTGKDLSGTGQDQRGSVRPFDFACIPNASGGDGSDIGAYEVQNTAPTISAASGVTRQQDAGVSNSSISTVNDAEDPKNTLTVTVNGSTRATTNGVTISNIVVDSSGNVTADIAAACGATAADFTLRVTDCGGLFAEATLNVAVTPETTPPVITSISASPSVLKPPNHTLRLVTVSVSDSDNCDPNPVCKIISVTSNEPDSGCSSGDKPNDIQNISGLTVQLRAERCGTGTSSIYTITVQCKDASGNASTKTTTVKVKK